MLPKLIVMGIRKSNYNKISAFFFIASILSSALFLNACSDKEDKSDKELNAESDVSKTGADQPGKNHENRTGRTAGANEGDNDIEEKTAEVQKKEDIGYANTIANSQPILLQDNDILEIKDAHYILWNKITLKDDAKLIIKDSLFEHMHSYSFQYSLDAFDNSKVIVKDSEIRSSEWLNWNFFNNASLALSNAEQKESGIWHSFMHDAKAAVKNSRFYGTMGGNAEFDIENSPDLFIEQVFPAGAYAVQEFPPFMDSFSFPDPGDLNIGTRLNIKNSTASAWGITVSPQNNISIYNTGYLTVTFAIGEPWNGAAVELDNLHAGLYRDNTWRIEDTTLRLVNVTANRWSPIVGGNNTLILKNSELADNAFSWGNAKIIIENCTASFLMAKENVKMTVRDSVISGDVVAGDNSRITLINTEVKGKTAEEGRGKIIYQKKAAY